MKFSVALFPPTSHTELPNLSHEGMDPTTSAVTKIDLDGTLPRCLSFSKKSCVLLM